MNSTVAVLDRVVADLDGVLGAEVLAGLSDAERLSVLNAAGAALRRVEAVVVETVAKAGRLTHRESDLTSGEALPARRPALRQALLDGAIGVTGLLAATGPIDAAGDRIGTADA